MYQKEIELILRWIAPYKCRIKDCLQMESEIYQNNHILLLKFEIGWQRVTTNIYEVWTYVNVTPHYHCKQLIVAGVHRYEIDKLSSGMQCFSKWFICKVIWLLWKHFIMKWIPDNTERQQIDFLYYSNR